MRNGPLVSAVLTAMALAPAVASGQTHEQPAWTLAECVRIAHQRSPLMRAARNGIAALEEQYKEAWWAWFPEIDVRTLATLIPPQGDGLEGVTFYTKTDVDLVMPLYAFGKIAAYKTMASQGVRMGEQAMRIARGELTFQVTRAWYGIRLAHELGELIADGESKLKKAREKLERLEEEDSDEYDQADTFRLRIYEAKVRKLVLGNERLDKLSRTGLRVALALPKGEALRLPKAQELQPVELTLGALAEYVDLAARKRPELKMQYERIGLQEANVGRYWADFFPAFFLGASFTVAVTAPGRSETETAGTVFENINLDSTTVGGGAAIGLKLTLDYPQKVARYRKATFELERARAELDVRKAKLRVELEQYWRETRAQQEMLRYQRRAMKAARSLLVLQVQEYENGVDDSVKFEDVLSASVAYLSQKSEWLRSVHAFNVSVARLSQAVGADVAPLAPKQK